MQNIEVKNLDAWVHSFLRRHKYEHTIIYDRKQGDAKEAWQSALALQDSSLALPADFYEEELEKIVLAQGVASRDDYRLAKRTGRSTVLNRSKRDAIWPVFEEYRAQLASRKLKEVDDAYRDAAKLLQGKAQTYYAVIVDETQDFGPQALRLLRAMVAAAPNDLFFVGDGHQRIYTRHRASMTACGIDIRGRSRKLYLNYRTTEEIRRAAVAALEGCEVDDLDDGSDEARRYKSLSHGPVPQTLTFDHMEGALREVASLARAGVEQGRSVCVIVPDTKNSGEVAANLKSENLATTILGPEERDQPGSTSVRIATMHRAKGLEFDEVVLLVPRSWSQGGDRPVNAGQLQYVALTRAKRRACVVRY
jgi:superfamily I DNA/RNA helicase